MSKELNQDLILQFYKAFDDRQMEEALGLLSPNFVAHMAGMPAPLNGNEFKEFGMSFYLAFSEGQHVFDRVIVSADQDQVVTCGTFTALHSGSFQGLPPTEKRISLAVMHIDCLANGKIVEHWGQGDALGLMQQLGIVFLPGPKLLPHILKNIVAKIFQPRA
jgi:predicted ester cyclase